MITVKLTCEGRKPLLTHPKTEEIMDNIMYSKKSMKTPALTGESPKQIAERSLIKDENGVIGLPSSYFINSLLKQGRNTKYKKMLGLSTSDGSFVTSIISCEEEFLPLTGSLKWEVDKRPVPTKSGGSQVCIRPKFCDWGFVVTLTIEDSFGVEAESEDEDGEKNNTPLVGEEFVKKFIEETGFFQGLGAGRKLGFGRFKIVKWEKIA